MLRFESCSRPGVVCLVERFGVVLLGGARGLCCERSGYGCGLPGCQLENLLLYGEENISRLVLEEKLISFLQI